MSDNIDARHSAARDPGGQRPTGTPGPGLFYRAPEDARFYAVGDVHGRADLLAGIHRAIRRDADGASATRKVVVYLGDYIDRGAQSAEVIEMLLTEPLEGFEAVHLKGNHEDYMLKFLEGSSEGAAWMFNGGDATLRSYGVDPGHWTGLEPELLDALCVEFNDILPRGHRSFLDNLALHHTEGGYLFVHAGIRPGVALDRQSEEDLMWIRDDFLLSEADHGSRVVHGHSIAWAPEICDNRIGIDTGAFVSGVLTCLVVEDDEIRFLTARR